VSNHCSHFHSFTFTCALGFSGGAFYFHIERLMNKSRISGDGLDHIKHDRVGTVVTVSGDSVIDPQTTLILTPLAPQRKGSADGARS
jgi:hypothetical protein